MVEATLGGWQVSGYTTLQSGAPVPRILVSTNGSPATRSNTPPPPPPASYSFVVLLGVTSTGGARDREEAPPIAPANGRLAVLVPGPRRRRHHAHRRRRGGAPRAREAHRLAHADGDHPARQADGEARRRSSRSSCPLATLGDVRFGALGRVPRRRLRVRACTRACSSRDLLDQLQEPLSAVRPMSAVFSPEYVRRLDGPNVKKAPTKLDARARRCARTSAASCSETTAPAA